MATLLDLGLLNHFQIIFPFLLVFTLSYAILQKIDLFKDNNSINAFISFLLAVVFLFSDTVRDTLNTAAPWFVLFFIFIIFTLVAYMALGANSSDIMGVLKSDEYSYINIWVITIVIIIVFGSLTHVLAQKGGIGTGTNNLTNTTAVKVNSGGGQENDFWATIVHPKVLGLVLILLIAMFAVQRLTRD